MRFRPFSLLLIAAWLAESAAIAQPLLLPVLGQLAARTASSGSGGGGGAATYSFVYDSVSAKIRVTRSSDGSVTALATTNPAGRYEASWTPPSAGTATITLYGVGGRNSTTTSCYCYDDPGISEEACAGIGSVWTCSPSGDQMTSSVGSWVIQEGATKASVAGTPGFDTGDGLASTGNKVVQSNVALTSAAVTISLGQYGVARTTQLNVNSTAGTRTHPEYTDNMISKVLIAFTPAATPLTCAISNDRLVPSGGTAPYTWDAKCVPGWDYPTCMSDTGLFSFSSCSSGDTFTVRDSAGASCSVVVPDDTGGC